MTRRKMRPMDKLWAVAVLDVKLIASLVALFLAGCASTPQTLGLAPAPTTRPLLAIATPSGLQSAYTASAKATANIFDESTCNSSTAIQVQGTIQLTQPLRVSSGAVTVPMAGTAGAQLSWLGSEPPIIFLSNNGGPSKAVRFSYVNIYAPNAEKLWRWDSNHTGSAYDLVFEHCTLTTNKGVHINLIAPGPGGRAYNWTFRDILIGGTGQIAANDNAHAAPICLFESIRCVNKKLNGPAFDLWNFGGEIRDCWIELYSTTVLNVRGAYSYVRWNNNYIEPHGAPLNGEIVRVDGVGCAVVADAIYFIMPTQHVTTANGGQVIFTGLPDCTNTLGAHPDWTQKMDGYADLLKQCFVTTDARSLVSWPSGRIDAAGLHNVNAVEAVQQQQATTQPQQ